MIMKNYILPFFILIVAIPALFLILLNNPTVKQAFTDIGIMMNGSEQFKQNFADVGSQIQIQGSNVYDTQIWKPLEPKPTTCFKDQNSVSDKDQFLDDSKVYNYYPQTPICVQ